LFREQEKANMDVQDRQDELEFGEEILNSSSSPILYILSTDVNFFS
jgi:hypothetical protein